MAFPAHIESLIDLMVEGLLRDLANENAALPGRNDAALKDSTDEEYPPAH